MLTPASEDSLNIVKRLALLSALVLLAAWTLPSARCIVCDGPMTGTGDTFLQHRGRDVAICGMAPCLPKWTADPELFFRKVQARSALFDEEAMEGRQLPDGWLVLGFGVLACIVGGAVWASIVVRKVPLTHAPKPCPHCKSAVHPAAKACRVCGATLDASVEAEIARA